MFDSEFCEKRCPICTRARNGNRVARFLQTIEMVVTFGGCPWGRARQRKYGVRPNQRLPQQQGATAAPPQEGSPITIKEAFELGYHAYWGGVALDRNPYDQGKDVEKFQSWIAGWCEAQEHDYVR